MIGRNDPCPCRSGKKYKKCCALTNRMTRENLVEEELERITLGYYDHAIKGQSGIVELKRHERAWRSKLGQIMTGEEIDVAVAEYFLYVVKRDLWNRYLLNMLDGPIRPATRDVLEAWKNPLVLYGKVVAVKEDHFSVEELLGTETYHVGLEAGMKVAEGLLVFGIVLPDNRQWENGIHLQGGLTFIHDQNGVFAQRIESLAEASGLANNHEFFKAHMVDIHRAVLERETTDVDEFVEHELTPVQQNVVEILIDKLNELEVGSQQTEICRMFAITYLVKEEPAFRKPEIIAASVFKAAYEYGIFSPTTFSQAEIATTFGVSASSMKKHADKLQEIILEVVKEMSGKKEEELSFS